MKDKYQVVPRGVMKKPARVRISEAEFRRKLKSIAEWRKKRLAKLRVKNPR